MCLGAGRSFTSVVGAGVVTAGSVTTGVVAAGVAIAEVSSEIIKSSIPEHNTSVISLKIKLNFTECGA